MFCYTGYEYLSKVLHNCNNYLEIGVFNGDGLALVAKNNPTKKIYAIDPFIEDGNTKHTSNVDTGELMLTQKELTYNNIKGLDNVVMFEELSSDFNKRMTDEELDALDVNVVFIDGDHSYKAVLNDMNLADRLIKNKPGLIMLDDMRGVLPGVRAGAIDYMPNLNITAIYDVIAEKFIINLEESSNNIIALYLNGGELCTL